MLTGRTRLIPILGHPVVHVRAPEFINPVFVEKGFDGFVVPLHVRPEDLGVVLAMLSKLDNVAGVILTIPHKEAAARLCHDLEPDGALVGAVNALRFAPGGRFVGNIFDGQGLVRACADARIELAGRRVLLIGAGGAGRAIAFAFARAGAVGLTIANRTAARAISLANEVARAVPASGAAAGEADPRGFDVVVNCTSLGLRAEDALPCDPAAFAPGQKVIDIIAVRDTEWMASARGRGCRVIGGRPMVEGQIAAHRFLCGGPAAKGSRVALVKGGVVSFDRRTSRYSSPGARAARLSFAELARSAH